LPCSFSKHQRRIYETQFASYIDKVQIDFADFVLYLA